MKEKDVERELDLAKREKGRLMRCQRLAHSKGNMAMARRNQHDIDLIDEEIKILNKLRKSPNDDELLKELEGLRDKY